MKKQRALLDLIFSRKRVDITSKNYLRSVKQFLSACSLCSVVSVGLLLWFVGLNYLSIVISVVIFSLTLALTRFLTKNIRSTSVKGDTLILTSVDKNSAVTSIRSLKKIKTTNFLGFEITKLNFNLDGRNRSSIIINRQGSYPFTPEHSIRKAYELSKKQKANHKPGSVTA